MSLLAPRSMPDWAAMNQDVPRPTRARLWKAPLWWAASPLLPLFGSVAGVTMATGEVALTLDDGPDPAATPSVLDALAARRVTATFFMIVEQAERYAEIVHRVVAAGHEVGLHGVDHRRLRGRPLNEVAAVLAEGRQRLASITGQPVRWFRPTYGAQDWRVHRAARRVGLDVAVWSGWGRDWINDTEEVVADRALQGTADGGVLLLHDGHLDADEPPTTAPTHDKGRIVDLILGGLADRGLGACSLQQLVEGRPVRRVFWL